MRPYWLIAIVEGHGEMRAVPVLVRRWLNHRRFLNFEVLDPLNTKGKGLLKAASDARRPRRGIEYWVGRALFAEPDAILVLLDADEDCSARKNLPPNLQLGPWLERRARSAAGNIPISVVVADREFEAWFLHGMTRIRRGRGLARSCRYLQDLIPEHLSGCKGQVGLLIGERYEPTVHQALLAEHIPLTPAMRRRSRSFDKLLTALEYLTTAARDQRRNRYRTH